MLIAHHSTAAAIAPHAADRSWVVFLQTVLPVGVVSPIRIVGMKGADIGKELRKITADNAYEIQIIGLIASNDPVTHAKAIGEQYSGHLHDGWYMPSGDLIAFIQHHGKRALIELLERVHPAVMEDVVDTAEMARLLSCSVQTIRRMVKDEKIPYFRVGNWEYRFQPKDVLAALQRQR